MLRHKHGTVLKSRLPSAKTLLAFLVLGSVGGVELHTYDRSINSLIDADRAAVEGLGRRDGSEAEKDGDTETSRILDENKRKLSHMIEEMAETARRIGVETQAQKIPLPSPAEVKPQAKSETETKTETPKTSAATEAAAQRVFEEMKMQLRKARSEAHKQVTGKSPTTAVQSKDQEQKSEQLQSTDLAAAARERIRFHT